ncbi:hypothetical protein NDU88_000211, partial [Pleurodeles waltl]
SRRVASVLSPGQAPPLKVPFCRSRCPPAGPLTDPLRPEDCSGGGEMSGPEPGGAPVTFQDFAAGFSVEEWTLLHTWQNELYRNLMKEIQQAFTLLGPAIAASVFSLRDEVKRGLSQGDYQDTDRRNPNNPPQSWSSANPDIISGHESDEGLKADHYQVGGERPASPSPGCRPDAEVVTVIIKEEDESCPMVYQDPEETQSPQCFTEPPLFPTKTEMDFLDGAEEDGFDSSPSVHSDKETPLFPTKTEMDFLDGAEEDGFDSSPSVHSDKGMSEEASFFLSNIKQEGVASSVDHHGLEIKGGIDDCMAHQSEDTIRNDKDPDTCFEPVKKLTHKL